MPELGDGLFGILTPLIRQWRIVLLTPLVFTALAVTLCLLARRQYTAVATFVPASPASPGLNGSLASLAGQFGISVQSVGPASPDFYAGVLNSRVVREGLLRSSFPDPEHLNEQRPLLSILGLDDGADAENRDAGLELLEQRAVTSVDKRTGVISLAVELPDPNLAAAVANRAIELLNAFNLQQLQTQSRAQRTFVGERLDQANAELQRAEDRFVAFSRENRSYAASPLLAVEAERLRRQIELQKEVVSTLKREFEQARIAEVRDTPVLTVLDIAAPPTRKSSPSLLLAVVLATILGGALGVGGAYTLELRDLARRTESVSYRRLAESAQMMRGELRRLILRGEA
jgi:uncharacterized protein involved in exopolysaccharide biosynthesis